MAQPSTRQGLKDYVLRQLGAPVLEINVADEQIDDLLDDALQYFNERHFDGVYRNYLKYQVTQDDIDRGKARPPGAPATGAGTVGIASTSATTRLWELPPHSLITKTAIISKSHLTLLVWIRFSSGMMLRV